MCVCVLFSKSDYQVNTVKIAEFSLEYKKISFSWTPKVIVRPDLLETPSSSKIYLSPYTVIHF